jgi:hypothetical protein
MILKLYSYELKSKYYYEIKIIKDLEILMHNKISFHYL